MRLTEGEAAVCKKRIKLAEAYCRKQFLPLAKRALRQYEGKQYPGMESEAECPRVVVNYTKPTVDTKVHSVAFNHPQFVVRPLTEQSAGAAELAKQALQYEWRVSGAQRECKRALFDREVSGFGVVYTGWLFETEDGQRTEDGRPENADALPDQTPDAEPRAPLSGKAVREDRFFVRRLNPQEFLIDPECDNVIANAAYCGYVEQRPLSEVKSDRRYSNTRQLKGSTESLKGLMIEADPDAKVEKAGDAPADLKRVRLYHYYERKRRLHAVFCDEHDDALLVEEWNRQADRYPFRVIQADGLNDEWYRMPGPLLIEHPQQEINESRTQLSVHRKISNPFYQAAGWKPGSRTKSQLRSGVPNRVVEVEQPLVPSPQLQPPREAFEAEGRALQAIQYIAGLNEYQTATPPTKRMTTSEVAAVEQGTGARALADRQSFEIFCAEVAEDCLAWLQQYSVRTRTLPIYDTSDNVVAWQDFTAQDIAGRFLVEVFVGSTTAPTDEDTPKNIGFLLQSLAPFFQMGVLNPKPLLEQLLKAVPGVRNTEQILAGPPQPDQEIAGEPGGIEALAQMIAAGGQQPGDGTAFGGF